jgi:bifunctional non-homologous end joining protein LigD
MRRAPATLPHVQPIVPVARAQPFDDPDWLFEPKYDGFRGLLYVTPRDCYFRSKRGNALKQFQELAYWVREELPVKEAILDGEVVALDSQCQQDFRGLLAGRGNLHYAAFDVLWVKGKDLRGLPLHRRKRALGRLIWASSTASSQVFSVEQRGRDLFAAAERLDLEGIVAKRKADPYGPQTVWYKVKNRAYTQAEGRGDFVPPIAVNRPEEEHPDDHPA